MSKFFCVHDYKIIDKKVFDCKMDKAKSLGLTPSSRVGIEWFEKTMVATMECSKCGKVKIKKIKV